VPLRVGGDAGGFSEMDAVGQLQQIGVRVVGNLGNALRGERGADRECRAAAIRWIERFIIASPIARPSSSSPGA
jgi:hypothetical protein